LNAFFTRRLHFTHVCVSRTLLLRHFSSTLLPHHGLRSFGFVRVASFVAALSPRVRSAHAFHAPSVCVCVPHSCKRFAWIVFACVLLTLRRLSPLLRFVFVPFRVLPFRLLIPVADRRRASRSPPLRLRCAARFALRSRGFSAGA